MCRNTLESKNKSRYFPFDGVSCKDLVESEQLHPLYEIYTQTRGGGGSVSGAWKISG